MIDGKGYLCNCLLFLCKSYLFWSIKIWSLLLPQNSGWYLCFSNSSLLFLQQLSRTCRQNKSSEMIAVLVQTGTWGYSRSPKNSPESKHSYSKVQASNQKSWSKERNPSHGPESQSIQKSKEQHRSTAAHKACGQVASTLALPFLAAIIRNHSRPRCN